MSRLHHTFTFQSGLVLEIAEGDLTTEPVDAIVNAANAYLQPGGGVAGVILGALQAWCAAHLQSNLKLVRLTLFDYSTVVDFLAVAQGFLA